nr:mitotic spindle assembly checkpoint protein MAD2A [Pelodiscus sinensis]|eukprot:XP_025041671.1 mitotic spindle assembly checkpoint protein MAD2A [Pelodiscus sinensis]
MDKFRDHLPQEDHQEFRTLADEGRTVARMVFQAALDVADSAAWTMAPVVMRWTVWLNMSGIPPNVQTSLQDLPFEGADLFSDQTDSKLHSLNDSRATLKSLGIHTPGPLRRPLNPKPATRQFQRGFTYDRSRRQGRRSRLSCLSAFGINSILYQRGVYPSETFTRVQKYGLTLLVTTDPDLKNYLNNVVEQLKDWLYKCSVQRLVVVISSIESSEVLERWQFDIECDKTAKDESVPREKSQKAIQEEIRSVIRQITATVTFLPLLETACAFDLLIYTDKDLAVPEKWEESGPQFIANSEEVRLRSFTTTIHKVNSMVAYKKDTFP